MLEEILAILYRPITDQTTLIRSRLETLVATVAELQSKMDALSTALTEAKARITADVEELRRLLENSVDPNALDAVSAQLDTLTASISAIDPDPSFPPPPPTP